MGRSLLAFCTIALLASVPAASRPAAPTAAPAFRLPTRNGIASLDSLAGKVVLVDFWASWCVPCRKSFPWMKSVSERFGPRGFAVVAINLDKQRSDAEGFLARFDAPFIVAFDPDGKTAEAYHVDGMPTTFLIDRRGAIVSSHAGFDPHATAAVESLIAKACAR